MRLRTLEDIKNDPRLTIKKGSFFGLSYRVDYFDSYSGLFEGVLEKHGGKSVNIVIDGQLSYLSTKDNRGIDYINNQHLKYFVIEE